jgi:short-subunit dehydrogenase
MSRLSLEGQIAVVTGASSGIGKAIALGLAAEGCSLRLVGRDERRLGEVAAGCAAASRRALTYVADLAFEEALTRLGGSLARDSEHVGVLVHGAGIFVSGPVESVPLEELDRQYRVNLRAPFALTQALLPRLRAARGQVVFINSSVALASRADLSQYAATKHGLKAFADALRDEVNPSGIRVLSVYPGRTATPQQAAIHRAEGTAYRPDLLMQAEDVAAAVIAALRLPRTAEVTNLHLRPMQKT